MGGGGGVTLFMINTRFAIDNNTTIEILIRKISVMLQIKAHSSVQDNLTGWSLPVNKYISNTTPVCVFVPQNPTHDIYI